ncbi:hypothetical protein A2U01_0009323 [Trifolium medium]|uniref:Uncharacterized protein n=1 Tax=Trifolium medium TaxID=97028 RepID=A0A392MQ81_9FABA|nr:hypothetical protein [Trifolium medium]
MFPCNCPNSFTCIYQVVCSLCTNDAVTVAVVVNAVIAVAATRNAAVAA